MKKLIIPGFIASCIILAVFLTFFVTGYKLKKSPKFVTAWSGRGMSLEDVQAERPDLVKVDAEYELVYRMNRTYTSSGFGWKTKNDTVDRYIVRTWTKKR